MRKYCETCKHDDAEYPSYPHKTPCNECEHTSDAPTKWEPAGHYKPDTNADRIRAMTDEGLADAWMKDVVVCHRCAYVEECECDEYVTIEKCKEGLLEWLKQPAEVE